MAVPIEGFSVVAQFDRISRFLDDGSVKIPNATALSDKHIWSCHFMASQDARKFLKTLETLGLNGTTGPDSDVVLVSEFDRSIEPYCEWLKTGTWEKAVIAWRADTTPDTVTARKGWDPKVGSGLQFHDPGAMHHLEFLRLENNVEVFLNTKTGEEVYIGRTSTPVDALFKTASEVVGKHLVGAGQPRLTGDVAKEISEAAGMLEKVIAEVPGWWNAQLVYGKSQIALGNYEAAYEAFHRAYKIEKNVESIPRELAGVCMELRRFDEAVTVAEAALVLDPGNVESLGNLAVAFLLAGRLVPARKAIDAAIRMNPQDAINQKILRVLKEVEEGKREQPKSLVELSKPAKPKRWSVFNFFRKRAGD